MFTALLLRASARDAQKLASIVGVAALLFCATPVGAQSLSELSREMEEKRAAAALDDLLAYRDRVGATYFGSSEPIDLVMTVPLVQRMAAAWSFVLRAEIKDIVLAKRYREATLRAKNAADLERVSAGEPAILGAIARSGLSVHEFVTAMLAYQLVKQVMDRKYPPGMVDFGNVGPNTRFLGDHRSEIETALSAASRLERDLDAAVEAHARK